jgi:uncharacterized protein YndB with AHSA1/START domain
MTRDKDRKRIIRGRMKKTGESYTAARAHILPGTVHEPPPLRADLSALAGMSDDSIAAKTGRTWRQWVRALDDDNAASLRHGDIARLVHAKHGIGSWWAQTVTVGYERIKGLRERGQRRDGTYESSRSRTFPVPVSTVFRAWADPAARRRWLDGVTLVVRTATPQKSMRLQWPDGTLVLVGFTAKADAKSVVAVAHTKLRDKVASQRAKAYWTERLDALAAALAAGAL